ncbi:adenine phosphoribosyltransferase [Chitinivibrio alkaliphilus]|uniref:Adenine phosphoribosyltransferase n=1 Tax=Chitinivibrio alkaliphilus ACht1 TaxID=1313304 RepID=U7D8Z0_9BACT|nr:adenine phosphoribosyltransferase [Chitinivibrio alkaliphilus]ERP38854.1 adenine phosphoribosyltransferase [Chitinivibrio alkaliphilus ACht1]
MNLDTVIAKIPDFPKPGILFYDITTVFKTPAALRFCLEQICSHFPAEEIDGVVGVESRGFIMSSLYAHETQTPLLLARKAGKLPGKTVSKKYALEYGTATMEMHVEDIVAGKRYLIVDDLIATGGTLAAVAHMIEQQGGEVAGIFSIIGLPFLQYEEKIGQYRIITLQDYHGE